jgi:hypothetical protein
MTVSATAARPANPERRFFLAMILAMEAAMLFGFARSVFLRPLFPDLATPPELYFYAVHGTLFFGWMSLLLVQALLVSARNTALHMRLGQIAYGLVPLMLVAGIYGSLVAARRPGGFFGVPVPPHQFLAVVLGDMAMFALFAGLALVFRRSDPQAHKRFILLASIVFMDPSIGRWPVAFVAENPMASFLLKCAFLIPMAGWDLTSRKRLHWATVLGAVVLIAEGLLRDPIGASPQWLAFADWATGLLG